MNPTGTPGSARRRILRAASGQVASVLALRAALAAVLAVAAVAGAVFLFRHSMRTAPWGPFLADSPPVQITRYSTPWLLAAGGAALLAGLLVVSAVTDLVRRRAVRTSAHPKLEHWAGA